MEGRDDVVPMRLWNVDHTITWGSRTVYVEESMCWVQRNLVLDWSRVAVLAQKKCSINYIENLCEIITIFEHLLDRFRKFEVRILSTL